MIMQGQIRVDGQVFEYEIDHHNHDLQPRIPAGRGIHHLARIVMERDGVNVADFDMHRGMTTPPKDTETRIALKMLCDIKDRVIEENCETCNAAGCLPECKEEIEENGYCPYWHPEDDGKELATR